MTEYEMAGNDGNKPQPGAVGDSREDNDPAAPLSKKDELGDAKAGDAKAGDETAPPDGDTIAELGDALGGPA